MALYVIVKAGRGAVPRTAADKIRMRIRQPVGSAIRTGAPATGGESRPRAAARSGASELGASPKSADLREKRSDHERRFCGAAAPASGEVERAALSEALSMSGVHERRCVALFTRSTMYEMEEPRERRSGLPAPGASASLDSLDAPCVNDEVPGGAPA